VNPWVVAFLIFWLGTASLVVVDNIFGYKYKGKR